MELRSGGLIVPAGQRLAKLAAIVASSQEGSFHVNFLCQMIVAPSSITSSAQ